MSFLRMTGRRLSRGRYGATAAVALSLAMAGCQSVNDRLLSVTDPDIINPSNVNSVRLPSGSMMAATLPAASYSRCVTSACKAGPPTKPV